MALTNNNFDGGTAGTGVTTGNSGGASGKAFTTLTIPSGSTLTYSTTGMTPGGAFGGRWQLSSATTAWFGMLQFTAGGTSCAFRWNFCLNTLPSVNLLLATVVNSSFAVNMQILLTSGNTIQVRNAAGTNLGSASSALTAGTVYGLEVQLDCGSTTTNGTILAQLYALSNTTSLLLNYTSGGATVNAGGGSASPQPHQMTMGNSDVITTLDVTFDDLLVNTGSLTALGPVTYADAGLAAATGAALDATVTTSGGTSAPAAVAAATGVPPGTTKDAVSIGMTIRGS